MGWLAHERASDTPDDSDSKESSEHAIAENGIRSSELAQTHSRPHCVRAFEKAQKMKRIYQSKQLPRNRLLYFTVLVLLTLLEYLRIVS